MQPKLADCFVVPKSMTVFYSILLLRVFYHAVVIMRIDCDCMFEEIMLVVQVMLLYFFNKFHQNFCSLFRFFYLIFFLMNW